MADMYTRSFIYSAQQAKELKDINNVNGNKFHLGSVVVNGVEKKYTSIVRSMDEVQYSDAKELIRGDIRHITYKGHSK